MKAGQKYMAEQAQDERNIDSRRRCQSVPVNKESVKVGRRLIKKTWESPNLGWLN